MAKRAKLRDPDRWTRKKAIVGMLSARTGTPVAAYAGLSNRVLLGLVSKTLKLPLDLSNMSDAEAQKRLRGLFPRPDSPTGKERRERKLARQLQSIADLEAKRAIPAELCTKEPQ